MRNDELQDPMFPNFCATRDNIEVFFHCFAHLRFRFRTWKKNVPKFYSV